MQQNVNQSPSKQFKISSYERVGLLAKKKEKKNGQEDNPKWITYNPK
jgi:hypothetical protein